MGCVYSCCLEDYDEDLVQEASSEDVLGVHMCFVFL
uniref:Family with sequence similarity 153 member A n=1 Tax=Homo sapiens TaxID=9606 RepID=D6RIF1_HUMAN